VRQQWSIAVAASGSREKAFTLLDELLRMPRAEPGVLEGERLALLRVDAERLEEELKRSVATVYSSVDATACLG
jgi:hypothetical protein